MPAGLRPAAGVLVALAACSDTDRDDLRVLCAASTAAWVEAMASESTGATIVVGSSSDLARQIADGAPADVFVSASRTWMDWLEERGALAAPAVVLAGNRLVCAAATSEHGDPPADLESLFAGLESDERVAIADPGVPAGEYARASLRTAGLEQRAAAHLVGQSDVRAVARAVAAGEVAFGFLYATDARAHGLAVLCEPDPTGHPPVEVLGALVTSTDDARAFLESLRGAAARELLAELGFAPPDR